MYYHLFGLPFSTNAGRYQYIETQFKEPLAQDRMRLLTEYSDIVIRQSIIATPTKYLDQFPGVIEYA